VPGRAREGLPIEAAYVHDLKAADRQPVDVSPAAMAAGEQTVEASVTESASADLSPQPRPPLPPPRRPQPVPGRMNHRLRRHH
jgi:hypothetical protein